MYHRMVIAFHKSSLHYKKLLKLQIGILIKNSIRNHCIVRILQPYILQQFQNNLRQPKIFRLRDEVFSILLLLIRYTQNNVMCINELFFCYKIVFSDCLHILHTCGSVLTSYATFLHRFYNLIFDRQYNCGYEDEHRPQNIYSRWNCVCNCNLSNERQYYFRCPES